VIPFACEMGKWKVCRTDNPVRRFTKDGQDCPWVTRDGQDCPSYGQWRHHQGQLIYDGRKKTPAAVKRWPGPAIGLLVAKWYLNIHPVLDEAGEIILPDTNLVAPTHSAANPAGFVGLRRVTVTGGVAALDHRLMAGTPVGVRRSFGRGARSG
jgi:hypothetical protein